MYAIVDIAGKQFKVSKGETVRAPKIDGKVGKDIQLEKVLLIADKGKVAVGQPALKGASVKAKIEGFGRDKKVIVFRKKRRKGFRVTRGHRQDYTDLTIKAISQATKEKTTEKAIEKTEEKTGAADDGA